MAQVIKTSSTSSSSSPRHYANNHYYSRMESSTDEASSSMLTSNAGTNGKQIRQTRRSNYDENILFYNNNNNIDQQVAIGEANSRVDNNNDKVATYGELVTTKVKVKSGYGHSTPAGAPRRIAQQQQQHKQRARSAAPMGRFVSAYPASRQPTTPSESTMFASPSSPTTFSQTTPTTHYSPYAFHVPASWQRRAPPSSIARSPSPNCRQRSPGAGTMRNYTATTVRQQQQPFKVPTIKQTRYGYVTTTATHNQDRLEPIGKFNQSLRSQTIEHIPSMVQVSVGDNLANEKRRRRGGGEREMDDDDDEVEEEEQIDYYNNQVCPSDKHILYNVRPPINDNSTIATVGRENPFKPGTELSWEADLMVRLIKRGYPIEDLNHLVAAAKELATTRSPRSKSYDRLVSPSSSCLHSNFRRANNTRSQTNLRPQSIVEQQRVSREQKSATLSGSGGGEVHQRLQQQQQQRDDESAATEAKQVWANSLSRTKSLPRSLNKCATSGSNLLEYKDVDSLDRLIISIERETSDLLIARDEQMFDKNSNEATSPNGCAEVAVAAATIRLNQGDEEVKISRDAKNGKQVGGCNANRRMIERLAGGRAIEAAAATPTNNCQHSSEKEEVGVGVEVEVEEISQNKINQRGKTSQVSLKRQISKVRNDLSKVNNATTTTTTIRRNSDSELVAKKIGFQAEVEGKDRKRIKPKKCCYVQ